MACQMALSDQTATAGAKGTISKFARGFSPCLTLPDAVSRYNSDFFAGYRYLLPYVCGVLMNLFKAEPFRDYRSLFS
jgi:hypothetical protein